VRTFCFTLLATASFFSCSKAIVHINDGLIGKWKLKEIFSGYVMGGNFQWNAVPSSNSHILEFYENGRYEVRHFSAGNSPYKGVYSRVSDSTLARTFTNQVDSSRYHVHKFLLSPSELIIDYPNIEGVIRHKYSATAD
jgi:hypothetical protein